MSHGFLFSDKKLVTNPSVPHSVIIRVKRNLRLRDTTENHGDNASHGYPRMSHGFLFSDMKKARNKTIRDPSVIIRVIDNLSVRDTTADYHDHLLDQHLLPFMSCTAVLAAHDVYASLWRAESLAIDVVDKGGGLFLLISSLLYNCGATCHGHAERLGEYCLPVVHSDCHGDYAAVRFTIV